MKKKLNARKIITHADWITIFGNGAENRGAELLKNIRDKIGVLENEKSFAGYGGGWFFEQFSDRGFRVSTNDEGQFKVELQGLFWSGAVKEPFIEFLKFVDVLKEIKGSVLKLTRVDVAIDIFGLDLKSAFPNPKSKSRKWAFSFDYSEHQTKSKNGEMIFTGFTLRKQRWSLTVYNKRIEIEDAHAHPIKKSYFNLLAKKNESITRVELRIKSAEALSHIQGILNKPYSEHHFCEIILKHWGDYHRIKLKSGKDEARFKKLFRDLKPQKIEKIKKDKIERLYEDFKEIKIRDKARDFIRYGVGENKNIDEITRIFHEQLDFLNQEIENFGLLSPIHQLKGDRRKP